MIHDAGSSSPIVVQICMIICVHRARSRQAAAKASKTYDTSEIDNIKSIFPGRIQTMILPIVRFRSHLFSSAVSKTPNAILLRLYACTLTESGLSDGVNALVVYFARPLKQRSN